MVDALRRPIPPQWLATGVAAAAVLVAAYCLAYTALVGRPETFGQSLAWALSNICPWLVALELAKRARDWANAGAVLSAAFVASVLLGYASGASDGDAGFELWRRVPALLAVAAIVAVLRSSVGRRRDGRTDIPLLPGQIDWVRAAGNYVELRAADRTIVHRASISALEHQLVGQGFIRIHRSMLVRRDLIARIRPHDVVLADGTHLKVGKRFRAQLSA